MPRINQIVRKHWPQLERPARHAILDSFVETYRRGVKSPQEPDYIAMLVLSAMPAIASAWRPYLAPFGIDLTVSTVYCHQRPVVDYGTRPRPELGDILFVHVHRAKGRRTVRRSLLLQAKVAPARYYGLASSDLHQLKLYDSWPKFTYHRPSESLSRDVWPKWPHDGAKYLMISPLHRLGRYPHYFGEPYYVAKADRFLVAEMDLSFALVSMLALESGRGFYSAEAAARRTDWTAVVWDLLRFGFDRRFRRMNIRVSSGSRYSGTSPSGLSGFAYFMGTTPRGIETVREIRRRVDDIVLTDGPVHDGDEEVEGYRNPTDNFDDTTGASVVLLETTAAE